MVSAANQRPSDNTPEGDLLRGMLEVMNEFYSQNLGRETQKGKKENAIQGKHVGGVLPLGYAVDLVSMKLVINEHEAGAVQTIYRMHLDGCSYGEIEKVLANGGYIGKRGSPIGKGSMHSILTNEKYTGLMVYNKSAGVWGVPNKQFSMEAPQKMPMASVTATSTRMNLRF